MNTLIVYDSQYGNTEKVARAIEQSVDSYGSVRTLLASQFKPTDLKNVDMLFIGSPTQGGRPTEAIQHAIHTMDTKLLKNVYIAAFDTRFDTSAHGVGLKLLMKTIGFAAPKMTARLQKLSDKKIQEPKGFVVDDKEGPLSHNELQDAARWAKRVVSARLR